MRVKSSAHSDQAKQPARPLTSTLVILNMINKNNKIFILSILLLIFSLVGSLAFYYQSNALSLEKLIIDKNKQVEFITNSKDVDIIRKIGKVLANGNLEQSKHFGEMLNAISFVFLSLTLLSAIIILKLYKLKKTFLTIAQAGQTTLNFYGTNHVHY